MRNCKPTSPLVVFLALISAGCGTRIIIAPPDGVSMRVAEETVIPVVVRGADGHDASAKVKVPAGYYLVPPPTTRPTQ